MKTKLSNVNKNSVWKKHNQLQTNSNYNKLPLQAFRKINKDFFPVNLNNIQVYNTIMIIQKYFFAKYNFIFYNFVLQICLSKV